MQKIILDTIEEFEKKFTAFENVYADKKELQDFLKQALTKSFEAGQKSREKEIVESLARYFYEQMPFDEQGKKPDWVEGGNSLKQDEARTMAIQSLSLTKESK